jgi:predicted RNA-binding Zn-ribbon protein involved in translation (DUF1610 family)
MNPPPLLHQHFRRIIPLGSLFIYQEREPAMSLSIFAIIGASLRAIFKNQYRCNKCGYLVVVDRMLRPDEQTCPICGAHLAYRGSAK